MTGRFESFDPRPGGSYQLVLSYDDARAAPGNTTADSDIGEARFVEILPDHRIVQAVDFDFDDPVLQGVMTITWG